ncbi:MAG: NAD(P)/FAD-dependent oxidoreductase [Anaerolineae bacterium]|nr:NAD(P)/FAD-dependent oxidoreductase [Anaerolineae bacterium]
MTTSTYHTPAAAVLGRIGLPEPMSNLVNRRWDAIIIGAGHNGLTCATYLARAGKQVLVLEARERIGGANTMEEPWPGVRMSPCAYVAGLLHPLVIRELGLVERGYDFTPAVNGLFIPFEDGSSIQLYEDAERCAAEIHRFAPADVAGFHAMNNLFERVDSVIRADADDGLWVGLPPTQEELAARFAGDDEALGLLFHWSMDEFVRHFFTDERLQLAYLGQGVIGTRSSPFDPGTASVYHHHYCSSQGGLKGVWGYVKGGMGMVSFLLADIARESGAVIAAGVPVARILPGEGVELAGGERLHAPIVVANCDPRVTLRLLADSADPDWRAQVESIPHEGATIKLSVLLNQLPDFTARPGTMQPHHLATINTPLTRDEWQRGYQTMLRGEMPDRVWTELYFQTAHDTSVVPAGLHTMSVFSQYMPYQFTEGDWDTHRQAAGQVVIQSIARFCSNLPQAVVAVDVMGPPDIERKVGLTGGHIFQGECLPAYMWDRRLTARTPMTGLYLCGAATHPGGSVIAINGRNAAMQILES